VSQAEGGDGDELEQIKKHVPAQLRKRCISRKDGGGIKRESEAGKNGIERSHSPSRKETLGWRMRSHHRKSPSAHLKGGGGKELAPRWKKVKRLGGSSASLSMQGKSGKRRIKRQGVRTSSTRRRQSLCKICSSHFP